MIPSFLRNPSFQQFETAAAAAVCLLNYLIAIVGEERLEPTRQIDQKWSVNKIAGSCPTDQPLRKEETIPFRHFSLLSNLKNH